MRPTILYCLLLFVCVACGKGGAVNEDPHNYYDPGDTSFPVVVINTPGDNQAFASGATIDVTGNVSDNSLFQGSIEVRNDSTGLVLKDQYYEVHYIPSYNFSMSCPVSVPAATTFTVTVRFEDHGHNQTTKTVNIKVSP